MLIRARSHGGRNRTLCETWLPPTTTSGYATLDRRRRRRKCATVLHDFGSRCVAALSAALSAVWVAEGSGRSSRRCDRTDTGYLQLPAAAEALARKRKKKRIRGCGGLARAHGQNRRSRLGTGVLGSDNSNPFLYRVRLRGYIGRIYRRDIA